MKARLALATFLVNLETDALQSEYLVEHNPEPNTEHTPYPRVGGLRRDG